LCPSKAPTVIMPKKTLIEYAVVELSVDKLRTQCHDNFMIYILFK